MIDFRYLINTLRTEKCVLFVGPEIVTTESGQNYNEALIDFLHVDNNENIVAYYDGDEFFRFNDETAKSYCYFDMSDFYNQNPVSENIFKQIAQIPTHLIISINPDLVLDEVLWKCGISHNFAYYNKTKPADEVAPPTKATPLLYNLFGNIEDSESLILTHNDLFDFLQGTLGSNKLPKNLREAIQSAHSFVFLGFKLDKWYVQLVLRLLNLPRKKFSINRQISEETKTFCVQQFDVSFSDISIDEFVQKFINECNTNKIELRKLIELENDFSKKMMLLIAKNRFEDLFTELKNSGNYTDNVIMLESQYSALKDQEMNKIIDSKDYTLQLNKIRYALIQIAKMYQ